MATNNPLNAAAASAAALQYKYAVPHPLASVPPSQPPSAISVYTLQPAPVAAVAPPLAASPAVAVLALQPPLAAVAPPSSSTAVMAMTARATAMGVHSAPPALPPPSSSSSTTGSSTTTGTHRRTWDENYAQLLIYKAMHGHCEVPYGYKNDPVLGKWVSHLRENQDQKLMSEERKAALNAIGFNWNPQENRWNEQFEKLRQYQLQFGTTKIPAHYKDRQLSKWAKRQRENHSAGILQDHRKLKLESIDFVWKLKEAVPTKTKRNNKINEEQWKKQYYKLVAYKQENGHCNCPKTYDQDPSLGKWVSKQRLQNNRGQLTKERKKLLEDIGFVFSFQAQKKQQEWNHMYQLLTACQATNTTEVFSVPKTGPEASSVARWVQRQREKYKHGKLDPGREVLLRKIHFPFPQNPNSIVCDSDNEESDPNGDCCTGPPGDDAADDVVAVVVDAMQREDVALQTAAEEDQAGKKIGHCIDVLAQYMSTTPAELAARLPLSSKRPLVGDVKEETVMIMTAFGRLMPKIVALRDVALKYSDDTCLREAQSFLEQVLRQQRPEAHRRSECRVGGSYDRLLSLAVDLGAVLDNSGRCRAVVGSCEMYLDHLMSQKDDGSHAVAAASMTEVSTADEDSVENDPPTAKRRKMEFDGLGFGIGLGC